MQLWFRKSLRHPLFRGLRTTAAAEARGRRHDALAGSVEELRQAAGRGASARRAVFVLQRERELLLDEAARDALWRLFRTPCYVLQVDTDNRVLAYECEARQGLHLAAAKGEDVHCGCGRPGFVIAAEMWQAGRQIACPTA